ncbi:hypothetical protein [Pseudonocardia sp. WMMC193]|uniref:hypothetical protein n=1 Tax=Pseudonocardia sp. WMMC193 TaxID=2911965 RepID=UPI001F335FA0|nr:hypothetical protein [Pseudonocardia sp. WMMC193]MCF7549458.1 hypothetical protein [Pseudonocardia sp. WMMC193]
MTARSAALFLFLAVLLTACGAPQAPPAGGVQTVRVAYAGGQVTGDTGTVPVTLGSQVHLEIGSDTAEEAHLHGYDKAVQVPAGGTATIDFTADVPGEFELELHHSGEPLATLQVR